MQDILLIIPAYNEESNIKRVCDGLKKDFPELDFVVVNDGSKDRTGEICLKEGYEVINLPINTGLAGAFQTGMKYAAKKGYGYAVQFDGDGQHRAEFVASMKEKMDQLLASGADKGAVVIASRFVNEKKPRSMRMLGSNLIEGAIRLTTGKRVKDPTSGMRMYDRVLIKEFAGSLNYPPEPDTISYLIRQGTVCAEVPAVMDERISGESYLKPLTAARYMLRMLISILLIQNFRKR